MATQIEKIDFTEALSERYLAYALSTIMSRSLPDVRDGLKPVHRRLLYAMLQLKLDPKSGYKKCARVVGDVIGKYHPHGDAAVYETLVRLAQNFTVRYPLIDGQGNFGSIDGDNAAAMRYTESKLTEASTFLMMDIEKNTVAFRPTYDGQEEEPVIFPASFPNLLANGSEGIAVGMATSIPPHNLDELCSASIGLVENPSLTVKDIFENYVIGPDFPTGAIIVESKESLLNIYETGRGSIKIRAKWEKEQLNHGLYQIVITEIPYQIQKAKLIEKIAELIKQKKLALLGNIRDESTENLRIVLEPKSRTCDPEVLMESLFKLTDLEARFNVNLNVLNKYSAPKVMDLKEILQAFLEHKKEVVEKRTKYILADTNNRLEILDGLLIAYLNLDEIIRIIREEEEPKQIMISKWNLTETQVDAILNMRLRSLRKLEEFEINKEREDLSNKKDQLSKILSDESVLKKVIIEELNDVKKKFGKKTVIGKRRSNFGEINFAAQVINIEAFIEKEPITIFCSKMGWIRSIKGYADENNEVKYKEGDEGKFIVKGYTTDKLIILSQNGKFFTIPCDRIIRGKGFGEQIKMIIDLEGDIVDMFIYKETAKILLVTKYGKGFTVESNEVVAQTRTGKQIINIAEKDYIFLCRYIEKDSIAIIGDNRKLLIFKINEIPVMKRGQGAALQKYKDGGISDIQLFNMEDGLNWKDNKGEVRVEKNLIVWEGKRGSSGKMPPLGFPKDNKFF